MVHDGEEMLALLKFHVLHELTITLENIVDLFSFPQTVEITWLNTLRGAEEYVNQSENIVGSKG